MRTADASLTPFPGARASTAYQIVVLEGSGAGQKFRLDGSVTLGRSPDATIMLDDPEVSRLHARVSRTPDGNYLLEDLGSKNGTFVNGTRVERRVLAFGDKIRIGPRAMVELSSFDAVEDHLVQRQRFEAIGRLGVGIAHDLNNVLAALEAGVAFLRGLSPDRMLGEPEVSECISDLTLAAERATGLTSGILAFARGRRAVRGPVDVSALGWEVVRMLRHTLDQSIRIEPHIEPKVFVFGNQSELHQVLLNLCLNARDAMPNGGPLRIGVSVERPPPDLGFETHERMVMMTVSDAGSGIPDDVLPHIFEPFFTTKDTTRSSGLGLATVFGIVEQHRGWIDVESRPGEGTTFHVYLPHLADLSLPPDVDTSQALLPRGHECILVVEDETAVREMVRDVLARQGFEVYDAGSGREALELWAAIGDRVDLVLTDIMMPGGMTGLDLVARLRVRRPGLKAIFMSGYRSESNAEAIALDEGINYLSKPYRPAALVRLVRERLDADRDDAPDGNA